MPKTPSFGQVKKPAAKKPAARKTPVKKKTPAKAKTKTVACAEKKTKTPTRAVKKTSTRKATAAAAPKRARARVLNEHPADVVFEKDDAAAAEALELRAAKTPVRIKNRRSAVDRLDDPPPGAEGAAVLVAHLGGTIERELVKIDTILNGRNAGARRGEAASHARMLASLARTLKEVKRLNEEVAKGEPAKDADDDAIPRDLDEFRRVLSRRLDEMVAARAQLPAGDDEPC